MNLYLDNHEARSEFRDWLAEKAEGLRSFDELIDTENSYVPTIRPRTPYHRVLADQFDAVMKRKDDPRRAYRGTNGEPGSGYYAN